MTQITTTPETKPESIQNFRLSVQVSLTGLSFLIAEEHSRKICYHWERHFPSALTPDLLEEEIREQLESKEFQRPFCSTTLIYSTELYTLVPRDLFDPKRSSDYLKFNAKILPGDFIAHDDVDHSPVVVVYVPLMNINNLLFDFFGSFQYFHISTLLIGHFDHEFKNDTADKVVINLYEDAFDLLAYSKGGLQMCNRFSYDAPEDVAYYVLFSLEQLGMSPDRVPLLLSGKIDEKDPLFELLYTYVRDVSLYETSPSLDLEGLTGSPQSELSLKLSL